MLEGFCLTLVKLQSYCIASKLIKCRDYKHYNPDKMIDELRSLDWSKVYQNTRVNDAWLCIKNLLSNVFDRHAPVLLKKVKGKPAPWLTCEVKKLMNERDKGLRKSRRTKNDADISQFNEALLIARLEKQNQLIIKTF